MVGSSPVECLKHVCAAISQAARLAGRLPEDVQIIAVSKTKSGKEIMPLIDAGQRHFGENRVQEAESKWLSLRAYSPDIRLHFIGQLQSNKAEEAVALFDMFHSVDRFSLVVALGKAMKRQNRWPSCFIQVNIGDEPHKGGVSIAGLPDLLQKAHEESLPIVGLMCIPPAGTEAAPHFALLAKLARQHDLTELSMGMSGDFETAVMLGATYVRIGTALFGERT